MKKVLAIAALAAIAGSAHAQLNPLPPPSTVDSVPVNSIGVNAGLTHWESTSTLGAYRFASDDNLNTPNMESPDNILGLSWSPSVNLSAATIMNNINTNGGTVRGIFVGESAGWWNDFGYTYDGNPQSASNSFTAFSNIQAAGGSPSVNFGDYFDVRLNPGDAANFDFWLNAVGDMGPNNPVPPTSNGGVYQAFHPTWSNPYINPGNVLWATNPIMVNTWVPALNAYANVATYLVGFEDWRLNNGSDKDYNDFMFAIQFFRSDGTPFTPVPEPSTYGLIGAVALLGVIARRRFVSKK